MARGGLAGARRDPHVQAHLEWIGFVRPTGLVVSAAALVRAGAILNRADRDGQRRLRACVEDQDGEPRVGERPAPPYAADRPPVLPDFRTFAGRVLGWNFAPGGYAGTDEAPIPGELEHPLPDYGETLRPDYAVRNRQAKDGDASWQLLVRVLETGTDFDRVVREGGRLEASAHGRMERLLRETRVPAGLLFNGEALRLVSAPRGESSGWMDFKVADMLETSGRPICAALRLLLNQRRLLAMPADKTFAALLEASRKFQNEVSERLAEQVLHALYELLRGFQTAHDLSKKTLLRETLDEHPDEVYRALLTVILRLVFLLYAEERGMLPDDEVFVRHYSLAGLHGRLREDAAHYPDTMNQRFGAWAQLLVLFRMVHDGAQCGPLELPRRHGVLFDPDRYPFLERGTSRELPLVPDGAVFRALENLLVLDGERLSYRALDVEQIGSVYETMMGFRLEQATGRSVAIKAPKKHGAPTSIDLEQLLEQPASKRRKWIRDRTDRKLTDTVFKAVKEAGTLDDLHAALDGVIDRRATPDLVPPGAMVLQPSEERRRSGSHYTPRALTEPIVQTTLAPVLERLHEEAGGPPRPERVLDLKVCDPAMGSGAFLVEACRQLGSALVEAWRAHDAVPPIPPDEDENVHAFRLVAQRCLYGVDRNPVAVDLSKVSLWLLTLAEDHPFTFVDHALRHGDSLVGLSLRQLRAFHWDETEQIVQGLGILEPLESVRDVRRRIHEAGDDVADEELRALWEQGKEQLREVRLLGDLVLAAFFEGEKNKERLAKRNEYAREAIDGDASGHAERLARWRDKATPLVPFHWEVEFPEVFDRDNPGFDAIVGNPPFGGKNTIGGANVRGYLDWLKQTHPESHGNADLVAHFFRRAFAVIREQGAFGLIATNTIAQGDTRSTGLRRICLHGGTIYHATKRFKWPGLAAVVVSVVHVVKGEFAGPKRLDGREVEEITAFLFHRGGHEDPARLAANAGKSFVGSYVLGMGFTFDDTDKKGVATPIAGMHRLIAEDPKNREVIFPYIGGQEVNTSPTHAPHRYVINFGERSEEECRNRWPALMAIVEEKVKPGRMQLNREAYRRYWWQYGEKRVELWNAIAGLERVLVNSQVSSKVQFAFLSADMVYAHTTNVFPLESYAAFGVLQSRTHTLWAHFMGSSMKDDLRYTPSDCFETFPFPEGWETRPDLEQAGQAYYEFRADLMVRHDEGLTKTYNRFHDPDERDEDIERLRELHAALDRAVLDAYGWTDLPTDCEFLLDHEIDEATWGKKKKPWRHRWPDKIQNEVLARLLDLNKQRAAEETRAGLTAKKRPPKNRKKPDASQRSLFD